MRPRRSADPDKRARARATYRRAAHSACITSNASKPGAGKSGSTCGNAGDANHHPPGNQPARTAQVDGLDRPPATIACGRPPSGLFGDAPDSHGRHGSRPGQTGPRSGVPLWARVQRDAGRHPVGDRARLHTEVQTDATASPANSNTGVGHVQHRGGGARRLARPLAGRRTDGQVAVERRVGCAAQA